MHSTQIVTIPEEYLLGLTAWVENHSGSTRRWDLVQGEYGTIYADAEQPSLERYLKLHTAASTPELACPRISQMKDETAHQLRQAAVDSYDWMFEGHFDELDLPHVLNIIESELVPRAFHKPVDTSQRLRYLRLNPETADLPHWEDMNLAQRALILEAFEDSPTEWATNGRLNSLLQDGLNRHLKEHPTRS